MMQVLPKWFEYADASSLNERLAQRIADSIRDAVEARGRCHLVLAGGRTPLAAFQLLASMDLPWSKVHVFPSDERIVPHTHPANNAETLRRCLAQAHGLTVHRLLPEVLSSSLDAHHAVQSLAQIKDAFDLVLLGMGADGHVASLFPGSEQLEMALDHLAPDALVLKPEPLPSEAPFARITLSLRRLTHTRNLLLLFTGAKKRAVFDQALSAHDALRWPVSALIHHPQTPLEVHTLKLFTS
jgi:6-phosphogluconolactonase